MRSQIGFQDTKKNVSIGLCTASKTSVPQELKTHESVYLLIDWDYRTECSRLLSRVGKVQKFNWKLGCKPRRLVCGLEVVLYLRKESKWLFQNGWFYLYVNALAWPFGPYLRPLWVCGRLFFPLLKVNTSFPELHFAMPNIPK